MIKAAFVAAALICGTGAAVYASQPDVVTVANVDKDCADFATQAEANAALAGGDPFHLDADDDGVACESRFGDSKSVAPVAKPELQERFHEGRAVEVQK